MLTAKQKAAIRLHWAPYTLKFKSNGYVMARKTPGGAWGVLYTPQQAEEHAACLG